MKVRLYGAPFWSIFWFCVPLHILILLVPVINLVRFLTGNCFFEDVKINIIGGLIYFVITSICVFIPIFIRRFKYQQIMLLKPSGCSIVSKGKTIATFTMSNIRFELDYATLMDLRDLLFFGSAGIAEGHVNLEIIDDNGKYWYYALFVTKITAKRIKRYMQKNID